MEIKGGGAASTELGVGIGWTQGWGPVVLAFLETALGPSPAASWPEVEQQSRGERRRNAVGLAANSAAENAMSHLHTVTLSPQPAAESACRCPALWASCKRHLPSVCETNGGPTPEKGASDTWCDPETAT